LGDTPKTLRQRITTEAVLFTGLLFFGFVLLPVAIYLVGTAIFGNYAGEGYGDFFSVLSLRILQGDANAWFLILSPYIVILIFRLMAWGWRQSARA